MNAYSLIAEVNNHKKNDFCLSLARCESLTDTEIGKIFVALANNTYIKTLNVGESKYCVPSKCFEAIAEQLAKNTTLTMLDVTDNLMRFDSDGVCGNKTKAIANVLTENKTLTTLALGMCCINDKDAALLADALKKNKTLTTLSLGNNYIGDKGAKALAEALMENRTLTELDLNENKISFDGAEILAKALAMNTTVKLHIYEGYGKERMSAAFDALKEKYRKERKDRNQEIGNTLYEQQIVTDIIPLVLEMDGSHPLLAKEYYTFFSTPGNHKPTPYRIKHGNGSSISHNKPCDEKQSDEKQTENNQRNTTCIIL